MRVAGLVSNTERCDVVSGSGSFGVFEGIGMMYSFWEGLGLEVDCGAGTATKAVSGGGTLANSRSTRKPSWTVGSPRFASESQR